jgi:hypothetical protein
MKYGRRRRSHKKRQEGGSINFGEKTAEVIGTAFDIANESGKVVVEGAHAATSAVGVVKETGNALQGVLKTGTAVLDAGTKFANATGDDGSELYRRVLKGTANNYTVVSDTATTSIKAVNDGIEAGRKGIEITNGLLTTLGQASVGVVSGITEGLGSIGKMALLSLRSYTDRYEDRLKTIQENRNLPISRLQDLKDFLIQIYKKEHDSAVRSFVEQINLIHQMIIDIVKTIRGNCSLLSCSTEIKEILRQIGVKIQYIKRLRTRFIVGMKAIFYEYTQKTQLMTTNDISNFSESIQTQGLAIKAEILAKATKLSNEITRELNQILSEVQEKEISLLQSTTVTSLEPVVTTTVSPTADRSKELTADLTKQLTADLTKQLTADRSKELTADLNKQLTDIPTADSSSQNLLSNDDGPTATLVVGGSKKHSIKRSYKPRSRKYRKKRVNKKSCKRH